MEGGGGGGGRGGRGFNEKKVITAVLQTVSKNFHIGMHWDVCQSI